MAWSRYGFDFPAYVPVADVAVPAPSAEAAESCAKQSKRRARARRSHRGPQDRHAPSGARPGATTWSPTATTRTACRAAAPTSATARSSTCRSRRARSPPSSAARSCTRSASTSSRSTRDKLDGSIATACTGKIDSLVELLQGKLSNAVMELVTRRERRPVPHAGGDRARLLVPGLGRHVQARRRRAVRRRRAAGPPARAAVPLRDVDHLELVGKAATGGALLAARPNGTRKVIKSADLSAVFGIEMDTGTPKAARAKKPNKKPSNQRGTSKSP